MPVVANDSYGHYNRRMMDLNPLKSEQLGKAPAEFGFLSQPRLLINLIRIGQLTILLLTFTLLLAGCRTETSAQPTRVPSAPSLTPTFESAPEQTTVQMTVPTTFTPESTTEFISPTPANLPSRTPRPTQTIWPTHTPTSTATRTPRPTAVPINTPIPQPTTAAVSDVNQLPNSSFEEGWYHINGIPELQVANQWTLEWDEGYNPLDPDPWNEFVRPESRVLGGNQLPADEHQLFIWDGNYTVKIFKQTGATSFRFFTNVYLQPGTYLFEINVFPDMIDGYTENGTKIWAPDPLSAEFQFIAGDTVSQWVFPVFGQRSAYQHAFQVYSAGQIRVGVAFRGRWAIENNGWFLDKWSLRQLSTQP